MLIGGYDHSYPTELNRRWLKEQPRTVFQSLTECHRESLGTTVVSPIYNRNNDWYYSI